MALRHVMRLSTLPSRVPPKAKRGGARSEAGAAAAKAAG
jgi:putative membrane protein